VRFRVLFTFGLTLPFALAATSARAEEPAAKSPAPAPAAATDELPPPGARTTHIVAGAATTVVSYGLALGASYLFDPEDLNGAKDLRIPIAGPWMALGKTGCPTSDPDCSPATLVVGAILMIFDGVAQAGGLGVIGEGLFLNTSSGRPAARKAQSGQTPGGYAQHGTEATVRAVPFNFGKDGVGLGVIGTF
jgi:hypothetical protein